MKSPLCDQAGQCSERNEDHANIASPRRTTHIELRVRAISDGIKTNTIHGSSAITSLIGECGLHFYKVGKTVTIMSGIASSTAYYTIFENLKLGNHTIVLLEWNQNKNFFLDPKDAIASLKIQEKEQVRKVFSDYTYGIVASRIGQENQKIIAGRFSSLSKIDFGEAPHTIIIPGMMHFTESDALKALAECIEPPEDNTPKIEKISAQRCPGGARRSSRVAVAPGGPPRAAGGGRPAPAAGTRGPACADAGARTSAGGGAGT